MDRIQIGYESHHIRIHLSFTNTDTVRLEKFRPMSTWIRNRYKSDIDKDWI